MTVLQAALEWLLGIVFRLARAAFLLQGLAFGLSTAVTIGTASTAMPAWMTEVITSAGVLSAVLFVAALALPVAGRWELHGSREDVAARLRPVLLGGTLVLVSALAVLASSRLPDLWREISAQLEAAGVWKDLARPGPYSGLILLPLLVGLMVPAMVSLAAVTCVTLPLALLVLLPGGRPRFPALLGMTAVCEVALVSAGWLAARALKGFAAMAAAAMAGETDSEVIRVSADLSRTVAVLEGTATALAMPVLGLVAWLAALRPWLADATPTGAP